MDTVLHALADPLVVILLAIGIFVARVVFLAKRLKWAASNPTLADVKALEEARRSLDAHKKGLGAAKGALEGNLEGARDTLRHYRAPLHRARAEKEKALGRAMKPTAFEEAKRLYESGRPKNRRRTRKDAPSP